MRESKGEGTALTLSPHRRDTELELWICSRLNLPHLFSGVTDTGTRRDRLKVLLLERGLTDSVAGRREGEPIAWRKVFEMLYSEEL